MVAFSIQASAPPFPLFVIAYAINGFGASLEDAQSNGFVASYKNNAEAKMGILHAAYGKLSFPSQRRSLAQMFRYRSADSSSGCDAVCPIPQMVFPLPCLVGGRNVEHSSSPLRFQAQ